MATHLPQHASRSVYMSGILTCTYSDVIAFGNLCGGPLERVKIIKSRSCAFLNFATSISATCLLTRCGKTCKIKGDWLKIAPARDSALSDEVQKCIASGGSRCIVVSGLHPSQMDDDVVRGTFGKYGVIERCELGKTAATISFTSILSAKRARKAMAADLYIQFSAEPHCLLPMEYMYPTSIRQPEVSPLVFPDRLSMVPPPHFVSTPPQVHMQAAFPRFQPPPQRRTPFEFPSEERHAEAMSTRALPYSHSYFSSDPLRRRDPPPRESAFPMFTSSASATQRRDAYSRF